MLPAQLNQRVDERLRYKDTPRWVSKSAFESAPSYEAVTRGLGGCRRTSKFERHSHAGDNQKEQQKRKDWPQRRGRRLPGPCESFAAVDGAAHQLPRVRGRPPENQRLALSSQDDQEKSRWRSYKVKKAIVLERVNSRKYKGERNQ